MSNYEDETNYFENLAYRASSNRRSKHRDCKVPLGNMKINLT